VKFHGGSIISTKVNFIVASIEGIKSLAQSPSPVSKLPVNTLPEQEIFRPLIRPETLGEIQVLPGLLRFLVTSKCNIPSWPFAARHRLPLTGIDTVRPEISVDGIRASL